MKENQNIRSCPPKLGNIIDRVNSLPNDLEDFLEQLSEMRKQEIEESKISNFYVNYAQNLSPELIEYLSEREGDVWFYGEELLTELIRERRTLFIFSIHSQQERTVEKKKLQLQQLRIQSQQSQIRLKFAAPTSPEDVAAVRRLKEASYRVGMINVNNELYHIFKAVDRAIIQLGYPQVDENSIAKFQLSDLAESIQTEKIEVDRIRICSVCSDFYWAKKINAQSCGKRKCVERKKYLRKKAKNKEAAEKEKINAKIKEDNRRKWQNQDFSKQEQK